MPKKVQPKTRPFLHPKLKNRIQIRTVVQTPNERGGFDQSYETIATVWAERQSLLTKFFHYVTFINAQNLNSNLVTEAFIVRYEAVRYLGKQFTSAFSEAFDCIEDLNPLKDNYFVFMERGSSSVKGRLYKIGAVEKDDEYKDHILFRCFEIEEKGTGAQEAYPFG